MLIERRTLSYCGNAALYAHRSGAYVVVVENDEPNAFAIICKTERHDEIPHVLEHCLLSGSKTYPYADPSFELERNVVFSYLNAITYDDFTIFMGDSADETSFKLMFDVYCDGVFNPLLSVESFDRERAIVRNELPDSNIDTATYNAMVEYYRNTYIPANMVVFFYGSMDFARLARHVGGLFDAMPARANVAAPLPTHNAVHIKDGARFLYVLDVLAELLSDYLGEKAVFIGRDGELYVRANSIDKLRTLSKDGFSHDDARKALQKHILTVSARDFGYKTTGIDAAVTYAATFAKGCNNLDVLEKIENVRAIGDDMSLFDAFTQGLSVPPPFPAIRARDVTPPKGVISPLTVDGGITYASTNLDVCYMDAHYAAAGCLPREDWYLLPLIGKATFDTDSLSPAVTVTSRFFFDERKRAFDDMGCVAVSPPLNAPPDYKRLSYVGAVRTFDSAGAFAEATEGVGFLRRVRATTFDGKLRSLARTIFDNKPTIDILANARYMDALLADAKRFAGTKATSNVCPPMDCAFERIGYVADVATNFLTCAAVVADLAQNAKNAALCLLVGQLVTNELAIPRLRLKAGAYDATFVVDMRRETTIAQLGCYRCNTLEAVDVFTNIPTFLTNYDAAIEHARIAAIRLFDRPKHPYKAFRDAIDTPTAARDSIRRNILSIGIDDVRVFGRLLAHSFENFSICGIISEEVSKEFSRIGRIERL